MNQSTQRSSARPGSAGAPPGADTAALRRLFPARLARRPVPAGSSPMRPPQAACGQPSTVKLGAFDPETYRLPLDASMARGVQIGRELARLLLPQEVWRLLGESLRMIGPHPEPGLAPAAVPGRRTDRPALGVAGAPGCHRKRRARLLFAARRTDLAGPRTTCASDCRRQRTIGCSAACSSARCSMTAPTAGAQASSGRACSDPCVRCGG